MIVWVGLICWILFVRLISGSLKNKKEKIFFLFMTGIALILVMGCRYVNIEDRGDLNNYARLYYNLAEIPWSEMFEFSEMEPGYLILNKLCLKVFPWTQSIIFIEAVICVFFTFRFIYKFCNDVFIGVLCYLAQGLMIFELTGFRQGIAISLCLFAAEFIERRKLIPFLLIVLLAASFHSTAIVFLPLYFISVFKPSFKMTALYTLFFVVFVQIMPRLLSFGSDLTGSDYTEASSWGNFTGPAINIVLYIVAIVFLFMTNKSKDIQTENARNMKWNMCIFGLIIYVLRFISLPFERVSFYFSGGVIAALPDAVLDSFDEYYRRIISVIMMALLICLFFVRMHGTGALDYRFFWS